MATRLHISGLTASISENDLKQRFSTFGDVLNVDGVGKLDGVGRPRKFAYLTLETTQPKLSRCMNLLSGSTWKGAKLRIGEAKPDYRARHELEINPPPIHRPKLDALARKRARLKQKLRAKRHPTKHAKNMNPVTLDTVAKHKGWRRTPLDHLIRPMRMRPLRPLPLLPSKRPTGKQRKRKFELTRARCTVIDPARYGAVHLTADGGLLGAEVLVERDTPSGPAELVPDKPTQPASLARLNDNHWDPLVVAKEKDDAMALLGGMFGNGEWAGKESVSDDDIGDHMEVDPAGGEALLLTENVVDDLANDSEGEDETTEEEGEPSAPVQLNSLKDMFKPQEETGTFSLGLDIELDSEAESFLPASLTEPTHAVPEIAPPEVTSGQKNLIEFTPDLKTMMFFPRLDSKQDVFDVISEKGWEWPHPGTPDQVRAKWDKVKTDLTREYTHRHREAVKRRKRGGARGDEV